MTIWACHCVTFYDVCDVCHQLCLQARVEEQFEESYDVLPMEEPYFAGWEGGYIGMMCNLEIVTIASAGVVSRPVTAAGATCALPQLSTDVTATHCNTLHLDAAHLSALTALFSESADDNVSGDAHSYSCVNSPALLA